MKWSSEAEANILPSWLKLRVLAGQSSLQENWRLRTESFTPSLDSFRDSTDWPGEAANAHQLLHVPQADQGIGAARGKVLPRGVKLDADAVWRVSFDGLNGLQLRITEQTIMLLTAAQERRLRKRRHASWNVYICWKRRISAQPVKRAVGQKQSRRSPFGAVP